MSTIGDFEDVRERPVPSVLRGFSAPVRLRMERSREELAFLLGCDSDPFNRWDAGQELAQELLLDLAYDAAAGRELHLDPLFAQAIGRVLADTRLDGSIKSLMLILPGERQLGAHPHHHPRRLAQVRGDRRAGEALFGAHIGRAGRARAPIRTGPGARRPRPTSRCRAT